MKFNKARVLAIGAAALMAATAAMPAVPVLAAETQGQITINKDANNGAVTYKGYEIFKADVTDDETKGKTVTNLQWVNDDVKSAVEGIIKADAAKATAEDKNAHIEKGAEEGTFQYAGTTAQDAADYIIAKITGTTNETIVSADSFAQSLAGAVDKLTTETSLNPGEAKDLDDGYWLFTTGTLPGQESAGTAPIFAVVGGQPVSVTEKTTVPTVEKTIQGSTDKAADYEVEKPITYELDGTVASNIATYATYKYKFTDTLPKSMTADASSVHVYAVNGENQRTELQNTTYSLAVQQDGSDDLTVDFTDLKAAAATSGATLDGNTHIVVEYTAKIDKNKLADGDIGGEGNANKVKLTYSNNPFSDGTGETDPDKDKSTETVYTYKLTLHKVDRSTEKDLSGAMFTIEATGAESGEEKQYVQQDGTLGTAAYEFTTDDKGDITVKGLDAGTYKVVETQAPDGYDKNLQDGFTFEIKPTYDQSKGTLTSLENLLTATDDVIAGSTDGKTGDNALGAGDKKDGANADTGEVLITMGDSKRVSLPLTGQKGIAAMIGLGAGIVAVSFAAYEKNKKKAKTKA